jgi:hypothetical protein
VNPRLGRPSTSIGISHGRNKHVSASCPNANRVAVASGGVLYHGLRLPSRRTQRGSECRHHA